MRLFSYVICFALAVVALQGCGEKQRAETYLQRGQEFYDKGDFARARLELRSALQIDSKQAHAWFLLANIAEKQQDWQKAFNAYSKAVELDPQNAEARVKKGALLLAANSPDDALAEAQAVLAADPTDAAALTLRGSVRKRQGDLDAAVADATAALQQDPLQRDALALLAGIRVEQENFQEARHLLQKATQAHPKDVPLKLALAGVLEKLGDTAEVQYVLEQLVESQPKELSHRVRLAQYLTSTGQTEAAEKTLRAAVAADPGESQPKLLLVEFLRQTKGFDAAKQELDQLIAAQPKEYALQFALADLYRTAGKLSDAEATYRKVIEQDDKGPQALRARSKLAALLVAATRPTRPRSSSSRSWRRIKGDADALVVRATIALQARRYRSGSRRPAPCPAGAAGLGWRTAADGAGPPEEQRDRPGPGRAGEGNRGEAGPGIQLSAARRRCARASATPMGPAMVLGRLLERAPDNAVAQTALARIQLSQPDTEALEKTAETVLRTRPDHPLGYYLKGRVLQRRNQLEASVAAVREGAQQVAGRGPAAGSLGPELHGAQAAGQGGGEAQAAAEPSPSNIFAINLLGEVYVATGRLAEAKAQYAEAIRTHPKSPLAYERLAGLQAERGRQGGGGEDASQGCGGNQSQRAPGAVAWGPAPGDRRPTTRRHRCTRRCSRANPKADAAANNLAMLLVNQRANDPGQPGARSRPW